MKTNLTALFALIVTFAATTAHAEGSFNVTNKTSLKIVDLQISEDGKKWARFDVGDGIPAGHTFEMQWGKNADELECELKIRAVYADKTISEPAEFDFCKAGVDLEFEE